jgi:hypothetical protein
MSDIKTDIAKWYEDGKQFAGMTSGEHILARIAQGLADDTLKLNDANCGLSPEVAEAYREAARDIHGREGECEIDDAAPLSPGDDPGCYVQSWVWVSNADANVCGICKRVIKGEELQPVDDGEGDYVDACEACIKAREEA